ncbi:MAG: hypothetical protein ABW190_10005 [Rhizobacter sp.]
MRRTTHIVSSLLLAAALAGCWGQATVGGTLSGLPTGNTVTLQNNAADNLILSANGVFTFARALDENAAYSVTVLTQPVSATCTVANGSGSIDARGRDVTNVSVTCTNTSSLTGTLSGLAAGTSVTLTNGGTTLVVAANGAFAFPGILTAGTAYNVAIAVGGQPAVGTCAVTSGASGTIVTGTPTAVVVTCS